MNRIALLPRFLFRYLRDDGHLVEALETPYLWFSNPLSLNDPFDLNERFEYSGTADEVVQYFKTWGRSGLALIGEENLRRWVQAPDSDFEDAIRPLLSVFHETYMNRIGVCCFSYRPDSTLLWAHYGGGHSGVCLVLLVTPELLAKYSLIKVRYSEGLAKWNLVARRLELGATARYNRAFDQVVLGTKYPEWAYEEEYRLISRTQGLNECGSHQIAGLIFGARMNDSRREELMSNLNSLNVPWEIVSASLNQRAGRVTIPHFVNATFEATISGWRFLTDEPGVMRDID